MRGIRVREGVARNDTANGIDQFSSRHDFADEDGVPPVFDLLDGCVKLQGRCQMAEVLQGRDFAAFVTLVLSIVPESPSQDIWWLYRPPERGDN